jgi:hypothetical protein
MGRWFTQVNHAADRAERAWDRSAGGGRRIGKDGGANGAVFQEPGVDEAIEAPLERQAVGVQGAELGAELEDAGLGTRQALVGDRQVAGVAHARKQPEKPAEHAPSLRRAPAGSLCRGRLIPLGLARKLL